MPDLYIFPKLNRTSALSTTWVSQSNVPYFVHLAYPIDNGGRASSCDNFQPIKAPHGSNRERNTQDIQTLYIVSLHFFFLSKGGGFQRSSYI